MPSSYAARRREIFEAARPAPDAFLRLDAARLRFSLGTTADEPRVPVQVAPDAAAIVRGAAGDLALLLATGHRAFVPADDVDRLTLSDGYAALPVAAPTLGPSGGGADLRAAALLGAESHPALGGGILCAWMGPGGRGRSLTALWIALLRQALAEMAGEGGREETPLLVALALQAAMREAAEGSRDRLPGPPHDRTLRAAQGIGLWVAARTGLDRAWRDAGRPAADPLRLRVEAVVAPGPLCGRGFPLGGSTLYGCAFAAGLPRAEEEVARLAGGGDADAAAGDLAAALRADDELARRAAGAVAASRLRGVLRGAVVAAEAAGWGERLQALRELLAAPGGLEGALEEEAARRDLRASAAELEAVPGDAARLFGEAARALKGWRPRDPAAAVGLSRAAALEEHAAGAAGALADAALERLGAAARRALAPRTGLETEAGAEAEWEAGRLYRLGARGGPVLRRSSPRAAGHLFADVKDFTRRTGLLGQATMAEFLRTEFYGPILGAAKRFHGGMGHLADRGGVQLNNLLGDAISFSGDVESLVELAREIRALLEAYGHRLARRVGPGPAALEAESRAGLEAGIFVSHGPAPLVVIIEDEVFGRARVAIAEKINESARGTARAAGARLRADAALEAARAARRSPRLAHAFAVFVDRPPAPGEARPPDPDAPGELYNGGAALSQEALDAFLAAVGPARRRREVALDPGALPAELRERWWFGEGAQRMLALFHPDGRPAELFRRVGRAAFKGVGDVPIWELCGGPAAERLQAALGPAWWRSR